MAILDVGKTMKIISTNLTRSDLAKKFLGIGAEIGVEQGIFSEIILRSGNVKKLYAIDAWEAYRGYRDHTRQAKLDRFYEISKNRLAPYNCKLVRKFSNVAALDFSDASLDFVYIDANHDYQYVTEDLANWSRKVKIGGIISGHDYIRRKGQDKYYAVVAAVNDFCSANHISKLIICRGDKPPSWYFIKEWMS
jgi:hypothetical protein